MNVDRLWALGRWPSIAYRAESGNAIAIRRNVPSDHAVLERLAALESRRLPDGAFLVAEVDGEVVDRDSARSRRREAEQPLRRTAHIRELLELQAAQVGRQRESVGRRFAHLGARASRHNLSSPRNENVMLGAESSIRP